MKTKLVTIIFLLFLIIYSIGQQSVDQDWNGFSQTIDISAYQGGQFRFKGFVKVENGSRLSNARLWARVDKKNGMTFNENMYQRPILSTLIMAGSKDIIKDGHTRLIASKIEKSKLIIFDKGTHFIPDENPGLFNKMVIDFFKDK